MSQSCVPNVVSFLSGNHSAQHRHSTLNVLSVASKRRSKIVSQHITAISEKLGTNSREKSDVRFLATILPGCHNCIYNLGKTATCDMSFPCGNQTPEDFKTWKRDYINEATKTT